MKSYLLKGKMFLVTALLVSAYSEGVQATYLDTKGLSFIAPSVSDKDNVDVPVQGEIVFDDGESKFYGRRSSDWVELGGGSTPKFDSTASGNQRIEYVQIGGANSDSNCDNTTNTTGTTCNLYHASSTSWLSASSPSAVTRSATGTYQVNFASSIFTSAPVCNCTAHQIGTSGLTACGMRNISTSGIGELVTGVNNVPRDTQIQLICIGAR
jgi:hypothetical protein